MANPGVVEPRFSAALKRRSFVFQSAEGLRAVEDGAHKKQIPRLRPKRAALGMTRRRGARTRR